MKIERRKIQKKASIKKQESLTVAGGRFEVTAANGAKEAVSKLGGGTPGEKGGEQRMV